MVNVAGTTVAVRVLSSGTQAINPGSPNFTQGQAVLHGNVGTYCTPSAGTLGPSMAHSGPMAQQATTMVQVNCL